MKYEEKPNTHQELVDELIDLFDGDIRRLASWSLIEVDILRKKVIKISEDLGCPRSAGQESLREVLDRRAAYRKSRRAAYLKSKA